MSLNRTYATIVLCALVLIGSAVMAYRTVATAAAPTFATFISTQKDPDCVHCVARSLSEIGATYGLASAFSLLQSYIEAYPHKLASCHFMAREFGSTTAATTPDFKTITLPQESGMCDYGFLQEFPRSVLRISGSVARAAEFCVYADKQLTNKVPHAGNECFRGLGQELALHQTHERAMKDDITDMSSVCERLTPTEDTYEHCLAGALFGLGRTYASSTTARADPTPLSPCDEHSETERRLCRVNFIKAQAIAYADSHTKTDLPEQFKDFRSRYSSVALYDLPPMLWVLAYAHMRIALSTTPAHPDVVSACTGFEASLQPLCVGGYALGVAKHSAPYTQDDALIAMCLSSAETLHTSVARCLSVGYSYLQGNYNPARFAEACQKAERALHVTCTEILATISEPIDTSF